MQFAHTYADRNEADYSALIAGVARGDTGPR
jgi:hypothetical protein